MGGEKSQDSKRYATVRIPPFPKYVDVISFARTSVRYFSTSSTQERIGVHVRGTLRAVKYSSVHGQTSNEK